MVEVSRRGRKATANLGLTSVVSVALVLLVSACALHPAPEDYSGVTSRQMARQIRCETRQAAIDSVLDYLTDERNLETKLDRTSYRVGLMAKKKYDLDPTSFSNFEPSTLSGYAKELVGLIYRTGVAYNYDLQSSETNNNSLSIDIANILPVSSSTLGLSAKYNLQRQNARQFTVADTLGELIRKTNPLYCSFGNTKESENFLYPMSGKIGIYPVLWEFINMSLFDNLSSGPVKVDQAGPSQLAEQLEFTTTIDASASPKITFAPIGKVVRVVDLNGTFQAIRKDYHKLTLGLFVIKGSPLAAIRGGILGTIGSTPFGPLASTTVRNAAEEGALAAVNQALALRIFQPRP